MADKWTLEGVSRADGFGPVGPGAPVAPPHPIPTGSAERPTRRPLANLLGMVVGVIGLAALGSSAWVYAQTQRELNRVATDIAQIRLSLELFGRQQAGAAGSAASAVDADALLALSNRLAVLEESARLGAGNGVATMPDLAATNVEPTIATGGDCLPAGMRFMVSAGDSYPVCGTSGVVSIASVDEGYVTLSDGTIVAQGGTVALPDTQCMVGVVPSDGAAISGFAEIRVAC